MALKRGLVMVGYDVCKRPVRTRYGVEDHLSYITSTVEDFFRDRDVAYVKIEGQCFVRKFHHEEQLEENN